LPRPEEPAGERKEEIEHFLDGKGPEDVPAARQVAARGFKEADAERESGEESAA
jgi:hypothetical protein